MTSKEIRSRLLHGATIDTICHDYHLTFSELVQLMSRLGKQKHKDIPSKFRTGHIYITYSSSGRYILRYKRVYYGSYESLNDAVKVRNWFIYNRWDKRWLDRACKETGVSRCTH